jgi:hypothetical protein
MSREADPVERDAGPPRRLDVDDRQRDRQPVAALEHEVQHRVVGVVVLVSGAGEAVARAEHLAERVELVSRYGDRVSHVGGQPVQTLKRRRLVDVAELRGEREGELVVTRGGVGGKVGEA